MCDYERPSGDAAKSLGKQREQADGYTEQHTVPKQYQEGIQGPPVIGGLGSYRHFTTSAVLRDASETRSRLDKLERVLRITDSPLTLMQTVEAIGLLRELGYRV